ncbi:MAG: hypothetical protein IPK22_25360 [Verrucomicrobiaceae bacterium]|nr:hypothetical protein [Verrucomicrobiaceae bacterium]
MSTRSQVSSMGVMVDQGSTRLLEPPPRIWQTAHPPDSGIYPARFTSSPPHTMPFPCT